MEVAVGLMIGVVLAALMSGSVVRVVGRVRPELYAGALVAVLAMGTINVLLLMAVLGETSLLVTL